jgi:hypothetical protein
LIFAFMQLALIGCADFRVGSRGMNSHSL